MGLFPDTVVLLVTAGYRPHSRTEMIPAKLDILILCLKCNSILSFQATAFIVKDLSEVLLFNHKYWIVKDYIVCSFQAGAFVSKEKICYMKKLY